MIAHDSGWVNAEDWQCTQWPWVIWYAALTVAWGLNPNHPPPSPLDATHLVRSIGQYWHLPCRDFRHCIGWAPPQLKPGRERESVSKSKPSIVCCVCGVCTRVRVDVWYSVIVCWDGYENDNDLSQWQGLICAPYLLALSHCLVSCQRLS